MSLRHLSMGSLVLSEFSAEENAISPCHRLVCCFLVLPKVEQMCWTTTLLCVTYKMV